MALISQTIDSLKGGISQQPEVLKLPEQGIEQINGWSSELGGVLKRNPIVLIKNLGDTGALGPKPLVHLIDRDESEKYFVCLTGGGLKVFDINGNQQEVRGDLSYIRTENPTKDLKILTIADYTFIVNTNKQVLAESSKNLPNFNTKRKALVVVKGGQYGRVIRVVINDEEVAKKTLPTGSKPEHVEELDAQHIIKTLVTGITRDHGDRYRAFSGKGYFLIEAISPNTIESLRVDDGYNNQIAVGITHYVQTFNKLPLCAPNDYIIKVSSDTQKGSDSYYVKYNKKEDVWEECIGWDVPLGFRNETMPHALVREAEGYFTFKQVDWTERSCGDMKTNPDPSFVGSTINDIFLFRNRLGLLSGENVILSKTGKYFDFYPSSVASLSDDDPIDIAVSSARISILKYAVPFDNELMLFSDNSQFSLSSNTTLTANNLQLNLASSYAMSARSRPFYLGKHIYYTNKRSGYSSIYKYYTSYTESNRKVSDDITSYVPTYVPDDVRSIRGSATNNILTILTDTYMNRIYLYKYYYDDEQLKQQAWSHWDVGTGNKVIMCEFLGSKMYLIIDTGTYTYLAHVDFTMNTTDLSSEIYRYHIDFKTNYEVPQEDEIYDSSKDLTTFKLQDIYKTSKVPFCYGVVNIISVNGEVFTFKPKGEMWTAEDQLKIKGDLRGLTFTVGVSYNFKYKFSSFLIKQQSDTGIKTPDSGRLQLRRAWVNYKDSGYFEVCVEVNKRKYKYTMSGIIIGLRDTLIGNLNIASGQFKFPCQGQAQNVEVYLESDTPTPLHIIGAGWEALYTRRTNQI